MIPGIIATMLPAVGAGNDGSAALYVGASVVLDFVNGVYRVNGVDVAASSLISRTDTITASGLVLDWNTADTPVGMLAGITDELDWSTGVSLYVDFVQYDTGTYYATLIDFWNGTFPSTFGANRTALFSPNDLVEIYDRMYVLTDPTNELLDFTSAQAEGDRRRVALTRTPDHLSLSVNGGAAVRTNWTAATPVFTYHGIGGVEGDSFLDINAVVRRLIFYPAQTDAALAALTAIA